MHEFFCLNVDEGDLLASTAVAYMISTLTRQDTTLFVNSVPDFAKYVKNVQFCDRIEDDLWKLARRGRKIQHGLVDGKTNLWLGHHRGHYVKDVDDPLDTASQIVRDYVNSCGIRKRVIKSKFSEFIDIKPAELPELRSFNRLQVCMLPDMSSDVSKLVMSSRDIYGFYNPYVKKHSATVPSSYSEWTTAVKKSDIVITSSHLSLFFFLSHLQNKKIIFFNSKAFKRVAKDYVKVSTTQELINEIREVRS